jgi:hypothetical protein
MPEIKIADDSWSLSFKKGNGILRREVWEDEQGRVVRYNLAYINLSLFQGDNGRVVGYDNAHGFHHRHFMGMVEPIAFTSFEDIEERFQADWVTIRSNQ